MVNERVKNSFCLFEKNNIHFALNSVHTVSSPSQTKWSSFYRRWYFFLRGPSFLIIADIYHCCRLGLSHMATTRGPVLEMEGTLPPPHPASMSAVYKNISSVIFSKLFWRLHGNEDTDFLSTIIYFNISLTTYLTRPPIQLIIVT